MCKRNIMFVNAHTHKKTTEKQKKKYWTKLVIKHIGNNSLIIIMCELFDFFSFHSSFFATI